MTRDDLYNILTFALYHMRSESHQAHKDIFELECKKHGLDPNYVLFHLSEAVAKIEYDNEDLNEVLSFV